DVFQFGQGADLRFCAFLSFEIDFEKSKVFERLHVGRTAGDQSLLVTEILIQYRSTAIAENGRQHFKSAGIVGQDTGSVETDSNVVLLDRSGLRTVAWAFLY